MKYTLIRYNKGEQRQKEDGLEGASHLEVLKQYFGDRLGLKQYSYVVIGKTLKRFDHNFREIKSFTNVFKVAAHSNYGLLALYDNIPELYFYKSAKVRDEVYKQCLELMSANSANPEKLPTIITVFLEGTRDSKSILTAKKITNAYADYATLAGKPTPSKTAGTSGKSNAESTAKPTWSSGSKASPSKPSQTFLGKVKFPPDPGYPSVNVRMSKEDGKVLEFTLSDIHDHSGKLMFKQGIWYYAQDWVTIVAKVTKDIGAQPVGSILKLHYKYTKIDDTIVFADSENFVYPWDYLDFKKEYYDNLESSGTQDSGTRRRGTSSGDGAAKGKRTGYITSHPKSGGKASGIFAGMDY